MNILIVDPSDTPDCHRRQRIQRHFGGNTQHEIRHASGMLDSAWLLRHFNPDVVVFPDREVLALLGRLFALQTSINPALTLLQLDDTDPLAPGGANGATPPIPFQEKSVTQTRRIAR